MCCQLASKWLKQAKQKTHRYTNHTNEKQINPERNEIKETATVAYLAQTLDLEEFLVGVQARHFVKVQPEVK